MNICLTLPSRTAVRSATFFGEEIAAVDGLHTRIFLFDTCGTCIESVNSLRCYSLLRYDPVSNGFVARCDTCGNRVFYLNCFFAEIGTASLGSLACEGPLYDVTMYDGRLYATFEDRVVAYTRDGSPLCTVVRPRLGVATRHYIRSGDESLTHIVRDGQSYIVHSSDGCGAGLVVPRGLTLRNFTIQDGDIYGAFTSGYLYTYLVPLVSDGVFPATDLSMCSIMDDIAGNCCN